MVSFLGIDDDDGSKNDKVGFTEYTLDQLKIATSGFSPENIVSEHGEKAPNVVYRGRVEDDRLVAVKRFNKSAWPDSRQFLVRAASVSAFSLHVLCVFVSGRCSCLIDVLCVCVCVWLGILFRRKQEQWGS